MDSQLVKMCIEAATDSAAAVEKWRRQRRSLERMPFPLAEALLHRLIRRRLLFPSLLEIFKYSVEEINVGGENSVDAEWMAYLGAFQYLSSLVLANCHRINNSALWSLTGMKSLKILDLSRCSKVTDAGIKHLLSIPTLEKLSISETCVSAGGVALLGALTNLSMLDLGGLPVTDSALISLLVLKKLEHIDLWGSAVSNDGVIHLRMFPSLSFLNLAWTSVTSLPNLSSLVCLNMSNCTVLSLFEGKGQKAQLEKLILSGSTITDAYEVVQYVETYKLRFLDISHSSLDAFNFLSSMKAMIHLNLSDSLIDIDSIEHIAYIGANLRYLNLCNTIILSDAVAALAGCVPKLETILLAGTAIDDTALLYISMMPSLKTIDLRKTNLKGIIHQVGNIPEYILSFTVLQILHRLERLDLDETQIMNAALHPLTKFSRLRYLSLRTDSLTDACFDITSCLPRLMHLSVRDALLTSDGLKFFIPPPTLKFLDLRGCWLLSKTCILAFCYKYPEIEVMHEFVTKSEKGKSHYASPPLEISPPQSKHRHGKLLAPLHRSEEIFLDQRLKYSRVELLSMQFSSASISNPSRQVQGDFAAV